MNNTHRSLYVPSVGTIIHRKCGWDGMHIWLECNQLFCSIRMPDHHHNITTPFIITIPLSENSFHSFSNMETIHISFFFVFNTAMQFSKLLWKLWGKHKQRVNKCSDPFYSNSSIIFQLDALLFNYDGAWHSDGCLSQIILLLWHI